MLTVEGTASTTIRSAEAQPTLRPNLLKKRDNWRESDEFRMAYVVSLS